MKKHLLWGAAAALVLSLSSCDDPENLNQFLQEGILGSAEIIVTGQNGYYDNNQQIEFASTIMDEFDTIATVHGTDRAYVGTLDLFANVDLSADGAKLRYPFMGFQINDSTARTYNISNVLTPERLRNFKFDSIADIVFNPSGFNVLAIAVSDTSWYVAYDGTITVTDYPHLAGQYMRGTIDNVHAYYFTESDVEAVQDHLEDPNFNLANYFTKTATLNSVEKFKSKRYPGLIRSIINEAYRQRGLWEAEHPER